MGKAVRAQFIGGNRHHEEVIKKGAMGYATPCPEIRGHWDFFANEETWFVVTVHPHELKLEKVNA